MTRFLQSKILYLFLAKFKISKQRHDLANDVLAYSQIKRPQNKSMCQEIFVLPMEILFTDR